MKFIQVPFAHAMKKTLEKWMKLKGNNTETGEREGLGIKEQIENKFSAEHFIF